MEKQNSNQGSVTALVLASGEGDWKLVPLEEDVGLCLSFGCQYKFGLLLGTQ